MMKPETVESYTEPLLKVLVPNTTPPEDLRTEIYLPLE
jgi:hypothetical protein